MNFDKYKNHLPYPRKQDYKTTFWYRAGKCIAKQGPNDPVPEVFVAGIDPNVKGAFDGYTSETVCDDSAFNAARDLYNTAERASYDTFKQDLFDDLGIASHPMRDALFAKAWEDGHSAGFSEVYNCASNLTDLIQIPKGYVLVSSDNEIFGEGTHRGAVTLAVSKLQRALQ